LFGTIIHLVANNIVNVSGARSNTGWKSGAFMLYVFKSVFSDKSAFGQQPETGPDQILGIGVVADAQVRWFLGFQGTHGSNYLGTETRSAFFHGYNIRKNPLNQNRKLVITFGAHEIGIVGRIEEGVENTSSG
jgi:hypothetical protein